MLVKEKPSYKGIYIILFLVVLGGVTYFSLNIDSLHIFNTKENNENNQTKLQDCEIKGYQIRNLDQLNELSQKGFTLVYTYDNTTGYTYAIKLIPEGNWTRVQ